MASRRVQRLNEQLKRELAVRLRTELRDPRIQGVTVTAVRTAPDLTHARVLVRVLGDDAARGEALQGLDAAAPYLRKALGQALHIRRVPELSFEIDASLERAARIEELLDEVRPEGGWDDAEETGAPGGGEPADGSRPGTEV
jgi:ribosome-binding factor A